MKRRKIMMISIFCSQVSLNLNDISSHTKQMGETSRLVQQVMMISKCHPKVQIIGFILDSDSEHFYSGAGSPQRPLGWWAARSERRRWRSCHPSSPPPPPAHLRLLLLNKQLLPPSILYHLFVSDCDNVGDHGDHDLRHRDDDQHALGKGDRPLRHRERSASRAGQPGRVLISNFQTFKSIFYNFVCVWWFVIWIFQVKISNL